MTNERLTKMLIQTSKMDMSFHSTASSDNGNKISIQGKNVGDSVFLFERLNDFLYANNVPFKLATINRYALLNRNKEQSHKAMTIYCPDGFLFSELCESVYSLIMDYAGWRNIKTPTSYTHYAGGLFTRNDRDANGRYLKAS